MSLIFFNLQTFGEHTDFCFDCSNEGRLCKSTKKHNLCPIFIYIFFKYFSKFFQGHRLNSTVINYTYAHTEVDCIFLCVRDSKTCRSFKFYVTSNSDRTCEFLEDVSTEKPEILLLNESYDYHILLHPNRVRIFLTGGDCI